MQCTIRLDTSENFSGSMYNRRNVYNKFAFVDGSVWNDHHVHYLHIYLELILKSLRNEFLIFIILMNLLIFLIF